ncbi:MAG: DNA alkylation repair protein [Saprospiraceae bacterium]
MTAKEFQDTFAIVKQEYTGNIPKREIFSLAKVYMNMPIPEVVKLLKNKDYLLRLSAVSILDWKARNKNTSSEEKKNIYQAYMDNHYWIDDWGLVDRAAPYVVGGYLHGKDLTVLYDLAHSKNAMERRTAITSTYYFIRKNELTPTFKMAEILVNDEEYFVQTAVGSWVREAGKKDGGSLKNFLNQFAATMPRVALRMAMEKLDVATRKHYLGLAKIHNKTN